MGPRYICEHSGRLARNLSGFEYGPHTLRQAQVAFDVGALTLRSVTEGVKHLVEANGITMARLKKHRPLPGAEGEKSHT